MSGKQYEHSLTRQSYRNNTRSLADEQHERLGPKCGYRGRNCLRERQRPMLTEQSSKYTSTGVVVREAGGYYEDAR